MTNLNIFNIFKRISALEAARARADIAIDNMRGLLRDQTQWLASLQTTVVKAEPKVKAEAKASTKKRKPYVTEKIREQRRAYARAHYAKKKAEREAAAKVTA